MIACPSEPVIFLMKRNNFQKALMLIWMSQFLDCFFGSRDSFHFKKML